MTALGAAVLRALLSKEAKRAELVLARIIIAAILAKFGVGVAQ